MQGNQTISSTKSPMTWGSYAEDLSTKISKNTDNKLKGHYNFVHDRG